MVEIILDKFTLLTLRGKINRHTQTYCRYALTFCWWELIGDAQYLNCQNNNLNKSIKHSSSFSFKIFIMDKPFVYGKRCKRFAITESHIFHNTINKDIHILLQWHSNSSQQYNRPNHVSKKEVIFPLNKLTHPHKIYALMTCTIAVNVLYLMGMDRFLKWKYHFSLKKGHRFY